MLDEISPQQWAEWVAFDHLEGIGETRADTRAAHMTAALMQAWGAEVTPAELSYLKDDGDEPAAAAETVSAEATVANVAAAFGALG